MNPMLPLCAAVLAAFVRPAACQTPAEPKDQPQIPVCGADQLVLEYLTVPEGVDEDVLASLMRLHRREILVRNPDGSVRGPMENCQESDAGMLVYDTSAYVKTVKDDLAKIVAAAPQQADETLKTDVYVPRFVGVERLASLLEPLRRSVTTRVSTRGPWQQAPNVTFQSSPAMIVMNDSPDQVQRMQDLLARIDQAPPQVLITCWLVRGSYSEEDQGELPSDLVDNLRQLLPYRGYGLITTAMVRASILSGVERSMNGTFGDDGEFELKLRPGAVDSSGNRLAFERIEFKASWGQHFDTSAVLNFNEYTVLGAAGSTPMLVVLQVKPVDGC